MQPFRTHRRGGSHHGHVLKVARIYRRLHRRRLGYDQFLRHNTRSYIFSASNTPAATAAALEALHIIQQEPERIEKLWNVTNYALKRFREEGFEIGDTESPIIPLYVRDVQKTFLMTSLAFKAGVFINPVVPPACAPQDTLVRYALMATHTEEQVERSVKALKKIFVEQGIIKG